MIHIARQIKEGSWLQEDRFEWFRKGFGYASTQTRATPALSKASPEEICHAVCAIMRGAGLTEPDEESVEVRAEQFAEWMRGLSYDQAERALGALKTSMCMECGGSPRCQCWNDE